MTRAQTTTDDRREGPHCSCLLFVDEIVHRAVGNKVDLLGLVGAIGALQFPCKVGPLGLFARFINVLDEQSVTVEFTQTHSQPADSHAAEPLWALEARLKPEPAPSGGPLETHTIAVRIPPFQVDRPGKYLLVVQHGGHPITTTPVVIVQVSPSEEHP